MSTNIILTVDAGISYYAFLGVQYSGGEYLWKYSYEIIETVDWESTPPAQPPILRPHVDFTGPSLKLKAEFDGILSEYPVLCEYKMIPSCKYPSINFVCMIMYTG